MTTSSANIIRRSAGSYGIIRSIVITAISLMLLSCASPSITPESTYTLPSGHRITYLTYSEIRHTPEVIRPGNTVVSFHNNKPSVSTNAGGIGGGDVFTVKCRTWVETDSKGNIVKWQTQSNDCTPQ
jgi:hypothetical protein